MDISRHDDINVVNRKNNYYFSTIAIITSWLWIPLGSVRSINWSYLYDCTSAKNS